MKVWIFYKKFGDLEPTLYGYTAHKERASQVEEVRNLPMVEKIVTKEEYRNWHQTYQKYEFIPFRFKSWNIGTVVLATGFEIETILLHGEEIVYKELSKHVLPPEIFSKKLQNILRELGYYDVLAYANNCNGMIEENPTGCLKVNQLGLFLELYGFTFK